MGDPIIAVLFAWAITLYGQMYGHEVPTDSQPPQIVEVNHKWLVDNACSGHECKVVGWYNGKGIVYLDENLDWRGTSFGSLAAASIVVHEIVHHFQKLSGAYGETIRCEQAIQFERQAEAVQREFLYRNGVNYRPSSSVHVMTCED